MVLISADIFSRFRDTRLNQFNIFTAVPFKKDPVFVLLLKMYIFRFIPIFFE